MTEHEFKVVNPQGLSLSCILRQPDSTVHCDHVVLLAHGYLAHKNSGFWPRIAEGLGSIGIPSVRFDFTGCQDSEGADRWSYGGYLSEVSDLACVAKFMMDGQCGAFQYKRFSMIGHSRGGNDVALYPHIMQQNRDMFPCPQVIMNIAGRHFMAQGISERMGMETYQKLMSVPECAPFPIPTPYSGRVYQITRHSIEERLHVGTLNESEMPQSILTSLADETLPLNKFHIIHGTEDATVPFKDGETLYQLLKSDSRVRFTPMLGCCHRFRGAEDRLVETVLASFKEE